MKNFFGELVFEGLSNSSNRNRMMSTAQDLNTTPETDRDHSPFEQLCIN